jgi:hypothetical protein
MGSAIPNMYAIEIFFGETRASLAVGEDELIVRRDCPTVVFGAPQANAPRRSRIVHGNA